MKIKINHPIRSERKRLYKSLPLIVLALFFPSIYFGIFPGKVVVSSLLCFGLISFIIAFNIRGFNYSDFKGEIPLTLLLVYYVFSFARGCIYSTSEDDYILLFSKVFFVYFLFPLFIFFADFDLLKRLFRLLCSLGLLSCLFNYIAPPQDEPMSFGHNMLFFSIFLLCLPYLKDRKYYFYFILLSLIAVSYNWDRRSITLNFVVSFSLLFFYRFIRYYFWRKLLFIISIVMPIIFLILGLSGVFNIFKFVESQNIDVQLTSERRYTVDSRTSIYMDVFGELSSQHKLLWGLGAVGRTRTSLVEHSSADYWKVYKDGRVATESGMLNFFQHGGVIGFLVYSFFFLSCAFYALFRSRNHFIRMLGYFICFKYVYSFIEDPLTTNVSTFCLFLWMGICLNTKMRNLSNKDMGFYLNSIFPKHVLFRLTE